MPNLCVVYFYTISPDNLLSVLVIVFFITQRRKRMFVMMILLKITASKITISELKNSIVIKLYKLTYFPLLDSYW